MILAPNCMRDLCVVILNLFPAKFDILIRDVFVVPPPCSGIVYQLRRVELDSGQVLYCLWVSRDPEDQGDYGRSFANVTMATSFNSTMGMSFDGSRATEWSCMSLGEVSSQLYNMYNRRRLT